MQRRITETGYADLLASGVVLTGGATILEGMDETGAKRSWECRSGAATPIGLGGLVDVVRSPVYATGAGLVLYGATATPRWPDEGRAVEQTELMAVSMFGRVKEWFREIL